MSDARADPLFRQAQRLLGEGRLDEAEPFYRAALEVEPDHANALHFLGVLLFRRGAKAESLALIERSLQLRPEQAAWCNNLGKVLLGLDREQEAISAYQRALALDPDHAPARRGLGAALLATGEMAGAERVFRDILARDPGQAEAHGHLADVLFQTKRVREGARHLEHSITLGRKVSGARRELLVRAHVMLGAKDKGLAVLADWLAAEPGNPRAMHLQAALGAAPVPARASDAYVSETFDSFAASFESKLAGLGYRAPHLVAEALARALPAPVPSGLHGLDAGCGTGLCAPLLAPMLEMLEGVDLSAGMLEKAQARGLYSSLHRAELTAFLGERPSAYDVVVAADTLNYFGAIEGVLAAAAGALRPNGLFVFTLEATDHAGGAGHVLLEHGRYAHQESYVRRALTAAKLHLIAIERADLRREGGKPVEGLVVTARVEI